MVVKSTSELSLLEMSCDVLVRHFAVARTQKKRLLFLVSETYRQSYESCLPLPPSRLFRHQSKQLCDVWVQAHSARLSLKEGQSTETNLPLAMVGNDQA